MHCIPQHEKKAAHVKWKSPGFQLLLKEVSRMLSQILGDRPERTVLGMATGDIPDIVIQLRETAFQKPDTIKAYA